MLQTIVLASTIVAASCFRHLSMPWNRPAILQFTSEKQANLDDAKYRSIAISGVVSNETGLASSFVFENLFAKDSESRLTAITDDVAFARKRLVSPRTVYSGLVDVLQYADALPGDTGSLKEALASSEADAWLAYAVPITQLSEYARIATELGLRRVVFGVQAIDEQDRGPNVLLEDSTQILREAGVKFTFLKYAEVEALAEAKRPYRIVRAALPLPSGVHPTASEHKPGSLLNPRRGPGLLASDDFFRIMVESLVLPKTFDTVYGVGPGTHLDTEILTYMRSQGWPELVQVGMLMGDLMETLEAKFVDQSRRERDERVQKASTKVQAAQLIKAAETS